MLIQLSFIALCIAALPLSIIWASKDQDKYKKLVWITCFLTFDLIVFGAFTRLTDSGLGCPDWPGCYGMAHPSAAYTAIDAAQTISPHGPVTHVKAWIEMIHRYLAMVVGVLIIAQLIVAWLRRRELPYAVFYSGVLLLWVCVQGMFGMWTVTLTLQPLIVTIHLLLGMGLLSLLTWFALRLNHPAHETVGNHSSQLVFWVRLAWGLVGLQIALGGWVSTNYAVLACTEYPLCGGVLIPEMDFRAGFTLWRELGKTGSGDYLSFEALRAIHWLHRHMAWIVLIVILYMLWHLRSLSSFTTWRRMVGVTILIQFMTGLANILFNWPLLNAVLHSAGAALLWVLLTVINYLVLSSS